MKRLLGISFGLALILGSLEPAGTRLLFAQPLQYIAKLTQVSGTVEVKYQGSLQQTGQRWSTWRKVNQGDQLVYGDLLRVQRTARAEIQCLANPSIRRTVPNDGIPWGVASVCSPSRNAR
jgi:hypothetical protein